ncbi:MAG: cbb3-type cytochrome c oxidase subunit 3 [Gammaproteobacteria bacterium PRO9]|nr:cbb3-type cytochrome c oxidase subunit 3 [Gammaproteobacteria bacterium PRO9]
MSPVWGHLSGVLIVLMMAAFIGIWFWAWLPHHRRAFGRLARLPMEDGSALADDSVPLTAEGEPR